MTDVIDKRPRVWTVEAPIGNAFMVRGVYGTRRAALAKKRKLEKAGQACVVAGYLIDRDETESGWVYADDDGLGGVSGRYVYEDRHMAL